MRSVRMAAERRRQVFDRGRRPGTGRAVRGPAGVARRTELSVLDIVYLLGVIVVFTLCGLLGKAAEKL